jgi:hypothetical protein
MDTRLEELQQMLSAALDGMSATQMLWHPPGKWCTAEVLEHLYLTYTGTTKGFERVLQAGKPLATRTALRQLSRGWVVLIFGYMPEGRKSPSVALPRGLLPEKVRVEIGEKIRAMDEIITKCEERFGNGAKLLDHPILGALAAPQWRKFHLVHGRHHAKQIRRLREAAKG